jgi:hypothetical protein
VKVIASLLLSFAMAAAALAAEGEKKAFPLPDGSKLELPIPPGWKDEAKEKTIELSPREGAPFQVVVAPVARQQPGKGADTAIQMRANVQQAADQVKPSAAEPYLAVEELKGAPGPGYYFSATDREPKPAEFKSLTRGMLLVGDVVVAFTILTNDGQEKTKDQALAMLKSAAHLSR